MIRGEKHTRTVEVPTLRLDEAPAQLGIPEPTAVKIDVEGAEWFVLDGARSILESGAVRVLCIELHPPEIERTGHRPDEIFQTIERIGFERSFETSRGNQDFAIFTRGTSVAPE